MSEEMRKEFEEWFISTGHNRSALNRNELYVEVMVEEMWLAWKASREAMKPIEFPCELEIDLIGDQVANSHSNSYSEGYNDALSDLELKITELGYKVEE